MNIIERNQTFEQYQGLIWFAVNRHRSLLKTLKLEAEDLYQELSIALLQAIQSYCPQRGAKASTYYFAKMRYAALNLWRHQMRQIRLANMVADPLVCIGEDGTETTRDVPHEIDYDSDLRVQEFLQTLSEWELDTLNRKLNGEEPSDVRHSRFMKIIRRKARRFCVAGGMA